MKGCIKLTCYHTNNTLFLKVSAFQRACAVPIWGNHVTLVEKKSGDTILVKEDLDHVFNELDKYDI